MLQTKRKMFGNYANPFSQKFTLKTKRGVISSETTIANTFNNYFVNITKSLNIPVCNPESSRNMLT